jgi:hypothetical protein
MIQRGNIVIQKNTRFSLRDTLGIHFGRRSSSLFLCQPVSFEKGAKDKEIFNLKGGRK